MSTTTHGVHERRLLAGEPRAARALVLDAMRSHTLSAPFHQVQLRAKPDGTGGSRLLFTGYACITEYGYEMFDWLGPYTEVVRQGAFAATLGQSPDVAFLLNHAGATMARTKPGTLRLSEDDTGLYTEADLDPARSDVQIIRSGIDGGELDEMSFAFRCVRQMWSPDYDQRDILEVNIHKGDTSVVNYGANDGTGGTVGLRQARALAASPVPALLRSRELADSGAAETLRRGIGAALQSYRAVAPEDTALIAQLLGMAASIDLIVDEMQEDMAEALGVPNPDDETDDGGPAEGLSLSFARCLAQRVPA